MSRVECHADFEGRADVVVPGSLRGYRQFVMNNGLIRSASVPYEWKDGENVAECNWRTRVISSPPPVPPGHKSPSKGCDCGFYALHHWQSLVRNDTDGGAWSWGVRQLLFGVVEAYGKIVIGSKGFRAEKMRIVDYVYVPSRYESYSFTAEMAELGVESLNPVIERIHKMVENYPPHDISELVR